MSRGMSNSMRPIETSREGGAEPEEDERIPRLETGLRILLSLLFVLVSSLVEMVLGVIVIFQLFVALATRRPPGLELRAFANRIISYYYKLGRYLTYNESRVPFPFSDFPEPIEEDDWDPGESAFETLGISPREAEFDDADDAEDARD